MARQPLPVERPDYPATPTMRRLTSCQVCQPRFLQTSAPCTCPPPEATK